VLPPAAAAVAMKYCHVLLLSSPAGLFTLLHCCGRCAALTMQACMRFHNRHLPCWPAAAACPVATSPPPTHPVLLPLQRLFKNDRVPHGWMAVSRYEEIEKDFTATYQEGEDALRTAFLINCGAAEDVRALLRLEQRMNVRVVIVDSHRCGVLGRCWVLGPAEVWVECAALAGGSAVICVAGSGQCC
jgi:hypothetical protein